MSRKKSEILEEKWNKLHEVFKDTSNNKEEFLKRQDLILRLRRTIGRFDRAEHLRRLRRKNEEEIKKDLDSQFIFFWIGFNALYARDPHDVFKKEKEGEKREHDRFKKYFHNLRKSDKIHNSRIYKTIKNTKAVHKWAPAKTQFFRQSPIHNPAVIAENYLYPRNFRSFCGCSIRTRTDFQTPINLGIAKRLRDTLKQCYSKTLLGNAKTTDYKEKTEE